MKVRFLGGGDDVTGFTHGRVYELVKAYKLKPNVAETGKVAIVDNTEDWYTYLIDLFEPVDDDATDLLGEEAPPIIELPSDKEEYQKLVNAKMKIVRDKLKAEGRGAGEVSDYMDALTTPDIEFITAEFGLTRKDLYAMTREAAHELFLSIKHGFEEEAKKRKERGDKYISERGQRFSEVGMRMQFYAGIPENEQIL